MIPLAKWLEGEGGHSPAPLLTAVPEPAGPEMIVVERQEDERIAAAARREEELLQIIAHMERNAVLEREAHREHERSIRSQLGKEIREEVLSHIDSACAALRSSLEEAVAEALEPFLVAEARRRSAAALADLISQELKEAEEAVLEIRAPAELHAHLAAIADGASAQVQVAEASEIAVVFKGRKARFEELSRQWCAAISSAER